MSLTRRSLRALSRRSLSLSLGLALVAGGTPSTASRGGQGQSGRAVQVGEAALVTRGRPALHLPNLDEERRRQHPKPQRRPDEPPNKCGYRDDQCRRRQVGLHAPDSGADELRRLLAWGGAHPAARRMLDAYGPRSPLDAGGYAPASDATFGAVGPRAALTAALPPPVQSSADSGDVLKERLDPRNRVGEAGADLLSGNFNWSLPIISLPGRAGLDFSFSLSYNSLVWLKVGQTIKFDPDYGNPSPGFHLGFPEIEGSYADKQVGGSDPPKAYLLRLPSGRRVALRQIGVTDVYESSDSSYFQMTLDTATQQITLRAADGTTLRFASFSIPTPAFRLTEIKDTNGNYLTAAYNANGRLQTVTDTLGRVFNFVYYEGGGAAFNIKDITQTWNGTTYTWAHFDYVDVTFSTNFGTLAVEGPANGSQRSMLHRVTTLDGAHWAFGYNSYGLVNLFYRFGADYLQLAVKSMVYNIYGGAMADCPRVRQTADHGWDWNAGWVTTGDYDIDPDRVDATTGARWGAVTTADGTLHKEFFGARDGVSPEATTAPPWLHGLTTETQTWAGGVKQKWAKTIWTQDDTALTYPKNPRVVETNVYDGAAGNRRRTTVSYRTVTPPGGTPFSLPSDVTEYDWQNSTSTPYRTARTEYEEGAAYLNRRILGLPRFQYLYHGQGLAGDALASKVEYVYDDGALDTLPAAAVQHDAAWGGTARGNPTRVRRHDVSIPGAFVESRTKYNVTGAATELTNPRGSKTDLGYADSFWVTTDSQPSGYNTFAYPTSVTVHDVDANNAPVAFTSHARYHFSFGALTRSQDPKGAVVTRKYDWAGRLERVTNQVDGAYTRYSYSNSHNYVQSFTTVNDLNSANEAYAITLYDGHGRVRASVSDHPGSAGGYSSLYRAYDNMGRLSQWSNPTEINSTWNPVGDDAAGYVWSQQAYDWQGRPTVTTNQDGTTREVQYSGCGCAGGQVTTLIDEVGRRQRVRQDVFGRTDKAEVLKQNAQNPSQWDVYSTTTTTYNVRGQATAVKAYEGEAASNGACPTNTCQQTEMIYDGHGRLHKRYLPVYQDAGVNPPYSTNPAARHMTWQYHNDDTPQTVTDPRGASATYSYSQRGLVTSISYSAPGGVVPTPGVTFGYDAAGNRLWMDDGPGRVDYTYNTLSRLTAEERRFDEFASPFQITYDYNLAGQVKSVTDASGAAINYAYDKTGRLNIVTGSAFAGVTQYVNSVSYRAWNATKQVTYGGGSSAAMSYNARLLVTRFEMPGTVDSNYSYLGDGRLSALTSTTDSKLNRTYAYDQAGRITSSVADGGTSGVQQYTQQYSYDAFGNTTSRSGKYWWDNNTKTYTSSYTDNRLTSANEAGLSLTADNDNSGNLVKTWYYTAQGVYTVKDGPFRYDAVGRVAGEGAVSASNPEQTRFYDGDGQLVKQLIGSSDPASVATYTVRASALGGRILTQLNAYGQKSQTYVYASGQIIAAQTKSYNQYVPDAVENWRRDPHNALAISPGLSIIDPMGVSVSPITWQQIQQYWQGLYHPPGGSGNPNGVGYGAPSNSNVVCKLDGAVASCNMVLSAINNGAVKSVNVIAPDGLGGYGADTGALLSSFSLNADVMNGRMTGKVRHTLGTVADAYAIDGETGQSTYLGSESTDPYSFGLDDTFLGGNVLFFAGTRNSAVEGVKKSKSYEFTPALLKCLGLGDVSLNNVTPVPNGYTSRWARFTAGQWRAAGSGRPNQRIARQYAPSLLSANVVVCHSHGCANLVRAVEIAAEINPTFSVPTIVAVAPNVGSLGGFRTLDTYSQSLIVAQSDNDGLLQYSLFGHVSSSVLAGNFRYGSLAGSGNSFIATTQTGNFRNRKHGIEHYIPEIKAQGKCK